MRLLKFIPLILVIPCLLVAKEKAGSSKSDLAKRVEVGKVKWGRDLDKALAKSKKTGKPVMILFQEVPG